MAAIISKYSNAHTQRVPPKSLTTKTLVHSYRLALFKGAQIPVDVQLQLESWTQLLALNVEENTYSQFHGTYPFLQRNCKRFNSFSFRFLEGDSRSRLDIKLSLRVLRKTRKNLTYVFGKKEYLLTPLTVTISVKGVNIFSRRE